jgi:hypothetical protein
MAPSQRAAPARSAVLHDDRSEANSFDFHRPVNVEHDVDEAVAKWTDAVVAGAAHDDLPQTTFFR